ncbi:hypothetical protein FIV42_04790 [Persicimonas caeni]|uniref:Uncharacterized protein n=1 Tax=Persicimonas caeni TaxID=2292766 RepID=A0A4Y6PQL6_PERCE|nr:hypothetical protein [Persicimonas caeni]QDG50075.1 hypothetical protein FIV42_04790 [Persicimonas caeni]QED31296.1 hypothetical protein FRD00_04785 [Persicimonas caeni]
MKRLTIALDWPGGHGWMVLILVVSTVLAPACTSTSQKKTETAEDEVIGRPPPADEDPFFVKSMPGEAVPVAASGSIGDEEEEEVDEPKAPGDSTQPNDSDEDKGRELAAKAPETETSEPEPRSSTRVDQPQCFSCVRICPVEGDCSEAKEDVICGWGVHEQSQEAKRRAKAECDATLDMARQMPMWSEIAGECPAATCR